MAVILSRGRWVNWNIHHKKTKLHTIRYTLFQSVTVNKNSLSIHKAPWSLLPLARTLTSSTPTTHWRPPKPHKTLVGYCVHEAPLRVILVLEILCSSTKNTSVLGLSTWCVFHVFGCALSVYHLRSQLVRLFTLSLRDYRAHGELNMV